MKRSIKRAMDNLKIDQNARGLLKQMWKHGYNTSYSCDGHPENENGEIHEVKIPFTNIKLFSFKNELYHGDAYVVFKKGTGDGWFEQNAKRYGLERGHPLSSKEEYYYSKYILNPEQEKRKDGLEKNLVLFLAITSIIIGIIFLSLDLTGNTIANLSKQKGNLIGIISFALGVTGSFLWFKKYNNF